MTHSRLAIFTGSKRSSRTSRSVDFIPERMQTETGALSSRFLMPNKNRRWLNLIRKLIRRKGPGRAGNGNFVLSEFVGQFHPADGEEQPVALQNATASYEQTGATGGNPYGKWAIAAAIDGDSKGKTWGWAVMEKVGQAHSAVF